MSVRYIIAPKGVNAGDQIQSGSDAPIKAGNTSAMLSMSSTVHCVELKPGKRCSTSSFGWVHMYKSSLAWCIRNIRLRSGEMRKVLSEGRATIGEVGNSEHMPT